jgi:Permease MlaE
MRRRFLIGGILAFVGAVQLRRFGAGIYVANLVGIAVVREMAAVMTAIVMAGRTGGAYAAHIATMQGTLASASAASGWRPAAPSLVHRLIQKVQGGG